MARKYKTGFKTKKALQRFTQRYFNKRKTKSKKYTVSIAKLADKKINTLLERRMREIAQDQKVTLISRRYFGPDSQSFHLFGSNVNNDVEPQSNNWNYTRFKRIGHYPIVYTLTAIAKSDINQPLNNPINPNDQDGVTQGMTTESMHGRRSGNIIKIKGISVDFRLNNDFGLNDENVFQTFPLPAPELVYKHLKSWYANTQGKCTFYWKVIEVPTNPNVTGLYKDEAARACMMREVLPFGYSSALDQEIEDDGRKLKYKVLMSGSTKLNLRQSINIHTASAVPSHEIVHNVIPVRRTIKKYVRFNTPITIQYEPTDQDGTDPESKVIFLVVKSDIQIQPLGGTIDPMDQAIAPNMSVCTKVYYTEP